MKTYALIAVLAVLLLPLNAQAEEQEKNFNLGIGTYALNVSYSNVFLSDDELSGFGLNALYAFTDNFAIRGEYYSLEHDDDSNLEVSGIDFVLGIRGTSDYEYSIQDSGINTDATAVSGSLILSARY